MAEDMEKLREEIMQRAYVLRAFMDAHASEIDDDQAVDIPDLMPMWDSGQEYVAGDRVRYDGHVYKVLQAHTSQTDWTPDIVPALYAVLRKGQIDPTVEEWVQPTAENPYQKGDRVYHPTPTMWESLVDSNVWEPTEKTAALSLWKRL